MALSSNVATLLAMVALIIERAAKFALQQQSEMYREAPVTLTIVNFSNPALVQDSNKLVKSSEGCT